MLSVIVKGIKWIIWIQYVMKRYWESECACSWKKKCRDEIVWPRVYRVTFERDAVVFRSHIFSKSGFSDVVAVNNYSYILTSHVPWGNPCLFGIAASPFAHPNHSVIGASRVSSFALIHVTLLFHSIVYTAGNINFDADFTWK